MFGYLVLRRQSGGAYDRIGLTGSGGKLLIRGQTNTGTGLFADADTGTFADADTGTAFSAGTYAVRIQLEGASPTTVRVKAWKAGTAEPTSWKVATTTSAGPQLGGAVGVRTINIGGSPATVAFDNLSAVTLGG